MKAKDLIEKLKQIDPEVEVYLDGGQYRDDYRPVRGTLNPFQVWGEKGVLLS